MAHARITRQLGIELPFVGAGMAFVGGPDLTAAVSNAGGVGLFSLGPGSPELLEQAIAEIRERTARPFGISFIVEETGMGPATTDDHIDVAVRCRVPLAVFFWNPPEARWVDRLKAAGARVWGTAWSLESAEALHALGVDAIIVQSGEAGGHVRATHGSAALMRTIAGALPHVPLIAAGGIADGATAAAAFALGADAVCVGTRLVASTESLASDDYKRRLLDARPGDSTRTTQFGPEWPGAPMRVLKNRAVARALSGGDAPTHSIGSTMVFGAPYDMPPHSAILPTRDTVGDHEEMCLAAGAGVGLVQSVAPAGAIVRDIMRGARARILGLAAMAEMVPAD